MGSRTSPNGQVSHNITYRDLGTSVTLTARRTPENAVWMDVDVQEARLSQPEEGVAIGTSDKGLPIAAAEFVNATLNIKLTVPAGQVVLAQGVQTRAKSQQAQTGILVTARLVDPPAQASK